jgi:hypothetical protein
LAEKMDVMLVDAVTPTLSSESSSDGSDDDDTELVDVAAFQSPPTLGADGDAAADSAGPAAAGEYDTVEFSSVPVARVDEVDVKQQKLLMKAIRRERK